MLINQPVPNLIGGVSQQPPLARFMNQLDEQVNFVADPVEGLRKRPPTETVARLYPTSPASRPAVFPIDRDPDNRFVAVVSNGTVRVFDISDGSEKTVSNASRGYLATATPATSLRSLTVADYTFIVNREVTVGTTSETAPIRPSEGLLWVRASAYGRTYTVTITGKTSNATRTASFKTPNGDQPVHAEVIDTSNIATNLRNQLNSGALANVTLIQEGSVIYIQCAEPIEIRVEDGQGGQALRAFAGEVQRFSDLPEKAVEGVVLKIVGDQSSSFDDYWVRYNGTSWEETAEPGSLVEIDAGTMPVALVRQPDDSFDLVELPWLKRKVGDLDKNPFPSFVGRRIRGMCFFRNRLGFLADENAYFSSSGDFFNLFRTTVTQLRDTDPIELQAGDSSGESSPVSLLEHAVSFDKRLLLFARNAQFIAGSDSGAAFTPTSAFIEPATRFQASAECRPVGAGRYAYFAFDRDGASGVREMFADGNSRTEDAPEVTAHCPTYLPPGIFRMTGSTLENVILAISSQRPNEVYVYNYFWSGDEKTQSAWSRWEFDASSSIYSVDFFDNVAVLVVGRPDGVFLERMRFRPRLTDEGLDYFTLLDSRFIPQAEDMTYDPVFNRTEVTLPYDGAGPFEAVSLKHPSNAHAPGIRLATSHILGNILLIPGDVTGWKLVIGRPYAASFSPTRPYVIQSGPAGGSMAATEVRLKLRSYSLDFARTGYFRAVFRPQFRQEAEKVFSGVTLGQAALSAPSIKDGAFSIKTPTENIYWNLTVVNDSPFPSAFLAASWMGLAESKSRRV